MNKSYIPLLPKTLPSWCPDPLSLQQKAVSLLGMLPLPSPVLDQEVICHVMWQRRALGTRSAFIFSAEIELPLVLQHQVMCVLPNTRFS